MRKCQNPNGIGQIQVMNDEREPAHHMPLDATFS
jgi:hypothetical protein